MRLFIILFLKTAVQQNTPLLIEQTLHQSHTVLTRRAIHENNTAIMGRISCSWYCRRHKQPSYRWFLYATIFGHEPGSAARFPDVRRHVNDDLPRLIWLNYFRYKAFNMMLESESFRGFTLP